MQLGWILIQISRSKSDYPDPNPTKLFFFTFFRICLWFHRGWSVWFHRSVNRFYELRHCNTRFYKPLHFLLEPWILMVHEFSVWKLPSNCLLNPLSSSGFLRISATWLINFQMIFLLYMSLSSVYLFSIQQLQYLAFA